MAMLGQFKSQLPELLSNPGIRAMAEGLIGQTGLVRIDTGRICDQCNVAIMGDRYASTTQPDFDLCAKCMLSPAIGPVLNNVHKFNKIAAFDALIQCLQNGGNVEALFQTDEVSAPARHCAVCDICSSSIEGVRHKCLDCADYDECTKCRATSKHPHPFYEISDVTVRTIPAEIVAQHKAKVDAAKAEEAAKEAERLAAVARAEAARLATPVVVSKPIALVKPVEAPKPVAPPAEIEREPSAFEKNLQTLESMGFTDRKKAIQALVRNRNQLFETIQELLK